VQTPLLHGGWLLNACALSGSLYQHYPGFEERMREALRILIGEGVEKRVEMGLAKDGSGVGGTHG
jgi:hexokinase